MLKWASLVLFALVLLTSSAHGETLLLQRAIAMAVSANADVKAARAAQAEAVARRDAAARAWMPSVTFEEGWQRGNQPVFAFGSLLAQRRFDEASFAVQALNHPASISNHRASVVLRQSIYDGGDSRARSADAVATHAISDASYRRTEADTVVAVVRAYGDVLIADAGERAAQAAIDSAVQDIARAEHRQAVGTATAADVLALKVHVAELRARMIAAVGDGQIARARLNTLIDVPIATSWEFVQPPVVTSRLASVPDAGLTDRPDVAEASLRVTLADAAEREARSLLRPRVSAEGGYEWNGRTWNDRAAAWTVGLRAEFSLSLGGTEAARAAAAAQAAARARADKTSVERAALVDLFASRARLDAALAREDIAIGAVSHAHERERIVRDRYDAGLAGVTDVLHAADAVLAAESLEVTAHVEALMAAVVLQRAHGRTPDGQP